MKSLFTSIPLQLALQCTENAIQQSTINLHELTEPVPYIDTPDSLRDENRYLERVVQNTTTTLTLLDETFTDLLKLTQRTGTQHLLLSAYTLQLRALLRLPHGSTALQYPCSPQTYNYMHVTTLTDQR